MWHRKRTDPIVVEQTERAIDVVGRNPPASSITTFAISSLYHPTHSLVNKAHDIPQCVTAMSESEVSDPAAQEPIDILHLVSSSLWYRVMY